VNDALERMLRKGAMTCFKVLSQNLPGLTKENHKTHRMWSSGRALKPEPSEYKAGVLMISSYFVPGTEKFI
jgi:hypothetical protein